MKRLAWLGVLGMGVAAQAQDACTRRYEAEKDRLVRELAAKQPAQLPQAQQQTAMRALHEGLARAAAEADRCERAAKAPAEAARRPALETCLAEVHKRGDALEARWKGRTMSVAEQTQRRAEEQALLDARMACQRQPKP
ncbi:hypothetical protein [Inhella proteolytica]|uniref:Uncharacterized protein n=1 Tax=Inhella proteolytica TaxID=2795029 RepID=A0A931NG52_9BURK|nr:hypothetical protein [Inhella proteolytica]MBH9576796.1 hypothetical protein [Inhella proteolytica]